jgi:AAA ATPase domain
MTTSISSSIELIDSTLLEHNPFSQAPIVVASNVWDKSFPDVSSLNSHASDAVFQVLEDIRTQKYNTNSILITAQNGTGKSHIIGRIRHRLQEVGGAFFILANKFNLNDYKNSFQMLLAESLSKTGSEGTTQWQELATSIVNDVMKSRNPNAKTIEPKNLVEKLKTMSPEKVCNLITDLSKGFTKIKSVNDPKLVRSILWTLSENEAAYASNWLGGKELAQYKANDLRLPTQNQSFDATLNILGLISQYNSLILCFDELDLADFNEGGQRKAQVIANLVKELAENLNRGVILSVMMPGTWKEEIVDKLPPAVVGRMTMLGSPLDLQYLNPDTTIDLVALFLKDYYDARDLVPPHPVYPFDEKQIRSIGREKPTVGDVLKWCKEHCKPGILSSTNLDSSRSVIDQNVSSLEAVEAALGVELGDDITSNLDDNQFVADSLLFSLEHLVGQEIANFKIKKVTTGVDKKKKKDPYLNFKIIGQDKGKNACIGIAVLQDSGGKGLGAGLKRLLDADGKYALSRGCLIRSKKKKITSNFTNNYIQPMESKGGEFVDLLENQIKPLIAIRAVYQKRESDYGVSEEDIFRFIQQKGHQYLLGIHSPLIQEILSDPSYILSEDIQEELEVEAFDVLSDLDIELSENQSSVEDFNEILELELECHV